MTDELYGGVDANLILAGLDCLGWSEAECRETVYAMQAEYEALRAVEEAARSAIPFGSWVSDEGPVHVNAQALADLASALAALDKARKPA